MIMNFLTSPTRTAAFEVQCAYQQVSTETLYIYLQYFLTCDMHNHNHIYICIITILCIPGIILCSPIYTNWMKFTYTYYVHRCRNIHTKITQRSINGSLSKIPEKLLTVIQKLALLNGMIYLHTAPLISLFPHSRL